MLLRSILTLLVLCTGGLAMGQGAAPEIDITQAREYFREAQILCEKDGGALWGQSLCVPIAFIHPDTRQIVANRPDADGRLAGRDGLFVGVWPDTLSIANSTAVWSGTRWTTLMWPMPQDKIARTSLILHECFHNIEGQLGFPSVVPANAHLDTREGRVWLTLEWRALREALVATGDARTKAVRDALACRAYRRNLFPASAESERAMEMHEGLAEYTGVRLSCLTPAAVHTYVTGELYSDRTGVASFINSFAYWSGPAYGTLLDELGLEWRKNLAADDDLGLLLQAALSIELPADLAGAAEEASGRHGGDIIKSVELSREQEHIRILTRCRERFVDGPVLILPLMQMNLQYDPRDMVSMDSLGTVYVSIRISDVWGIVEVSRGALMSPRWNELKVSAPDDPSVRPLYGDGWSLQLNDGWEMVPADRHGDFTLKVKP